MGVAFNAIAKSYFVTDETALEMTLHLVICLGTLNCLCPKQVMYFVF